MTETRKITKVFSVSEKVANKLIATYWNDRSRGWSEDRANAYIMSAKGMILSERIVWECDTLDVMEEAKG